VPDSLSRAASLAVAGRFIISARGSESDSGHPFRRGALNKVFCIGLPKTGTKTLRAALLQLGYPARRVMSFSLENCDLYWHGDFDALCERARGLDAVMDWPWCLLYQPLARAFPSALFVLTTRLSEQVWFESVKAHAGKRRGRRLSAGMRPRVYGYEAPEDNPAHHMQFYLQHNADVRRYFARQTKTRLLELCWEKGDGWGELCGALGVPQPEAPFPHVNVGGYREGREESA
jgi:hypothetical protein